MATDVEICSNALMLLGQAPIASLSEPTNKTAILCANTYPNARLDILRRHNWNCAIWRVDLAPLAGTPPGSEWSNWFLRPGDWVRTLDVLPRGLEYAFEGNRILANTTALTLRYIRNVSESQWDSHLVDLAIKRMVKDLAYPVTKSTSLAQLKATEYADALKWAKTVDGQENPPESIDADGGSPFIAARGR